MDRFHVPDMSCGHCVAAIAGAVKAVDPSASVEADLAIGEVTVRSVANTGRVEAAMKDAGYESRRLSD